MRITIRIINLLAIILFSSATIASAARITITNTSNISPNNAQPAGALINQANVVVYSFSAFASGANDAVFTSVSFNSSAVTGGAVPSTTTSTLSLYYQTTSGAFDPVNANFVSSLAAPTSNANFTMPNPTTVPSGSTYYFFLVENFNQPTTAGSIYFSAVSAGGVTINPVPTPAQLQGNTYSWLAATSVTLTSYKTPGSNGLPTSPIYSSQTDVPIYGFLLKGGTGGQPTSINSLTFYNSVTGAGGNNTYFGTISIYSSSTNMFPGASPSTLVASIPSDGTKFATFSNLNLPVSANSSSYYFVVISNLASTTGSNYELDYNANLGVNSITAGAANTGYNYSIKPPTFTITTNTAGIQASTIPYYYGSQADVLESFSVTSAFTGALFTGFTLNTYIGGTNNTVYNAFFNNLKLYSSSYPTYASAAAAAALTSVPYSNTGTYINPVLSLTTAQALSATPIYYYLVADFANGDDAFTNTTTGTSFQFQLAAATATDNGSAMTATNSFNINSTTYSLLSPVALTTASTTGLATANQLTYNQPGVGIFGFTLTTATGQPQNIRSMTFTANISSVSSNIGTFFANFVLLESTSGGVYTTAIPVGTAYTISGTGGLTLTVTFSGSPLVIAAGSSPTFYLKADYSAPLNFTSTFQLVATNVQAVGPIIYTAGTTSTSNRGVVTTNVNGIIYNCTPTVTLGNSPGGGLAANPIINTQNGLVMFGFAVTTGPANTFNSFSLYSTQPAGSFIGDYFRNFKLYVSTSGGAYSGGVTPVSGAIFSTVNGTTTFTISGFSQLIPANTTYTFYIVADYYQSPTVATTFELNLTSASTASNTYTTGGPVIGNNYTLTGPIGVWYWTDAGGDNIWENASNWLNAHTNSISGYPNYVAATKTDLAVFSPTYLATNRFGNVPAADGNVYITASKTISQVLVTSYNPVSYIFYIQNGYTFTTSGGISLADPSANVNVTRGTNATSTFLTLDEYYVNGTGKYVIGGTSSLYSFGTLIFDGYALVTFPTGSAVNMYGGGTKFSQSQFELNATASLTVTNTIFTLSGAQSVVFLNGGTFAANNSTFNLSGLGAEFQNLGANATFTNCTSNVTGISNDNTLTGFALTGGTTTSSGSIFNLGTTASNGNYALFELQDGTFNLNATSAMNLIGPSSSIYNDGYTPSTVTSFNVSSSTINLGSTAGSDGINSSLVNTDNAFFYLNAGGIININGASAALYNTNSQNKAGNTFYGIFVAAPKSILNPVNASAIIENDAASNYFTLQSDQFASATIDSLGANAIVSGQYNVQRYLNGGATYLRNYRMLSSPINVNSYLSSSSNTIDLRYLGANAAIPNTILTYNGAFLLGPDATFGGGNHTIPNPALYLYHEYLTPGSTYNSSFISGKNVGVISLKSSGTVATKATAAGAVASDNSSSVAVPPGNGYIMYYIDNNTRTTPASTPGAPRASTITASGYINQGQVQLFMWGLGSNLSDTYGIAGVRLPGITVVGNPYPSTIDLHRVYIHNASCITPVMYQLDNMNQQFDSYNALTGLSSTAASSEYVGSGLGFYIHVDSLGTTKHFAFYEGDKVKQGSAGFYPPVSQFDIPSLPTTKDNNLVPLAQQEPLNIPSINDKRVNIAGTISGLPVANLLSEKMSPVVESTSFITTAAGSVGDSTVKSTIQLPNFRSTLNRLRSHVLLVKHETALPISTKVTASVINNPAGLHLKLVVDSTNTDEIGVYFNKGWSDKYDNNDALDLDGQTGKVFLSSFSSDGIRTSINTMGDYTGGKRIKLYVKAAADGIYQIEMTDIATSFNKNQYSVFLIDNLKKDSLDLTLYKLYHFNFAVADTGSYKNRFVLAIEHKPVAHYQLLTFAGQKVNAGVQLNWKTINEANSTTFVVEKLNANTAYVFLDSLHSDSAGAYTFVDQHPVLGNNTYRLQQTDDLNNITYSAPVNIGYNSSLPNGGLTVYPNPSRSTITVTLTSSSIATKVATADIYNTSGTLIDHKVVSSNSFNHNISNYKSGIYIIELKDSNGDLVGKAKFVKVE